MKQYRWSIRWSSRKGIVNYQFGIKQKNQAQERNKKRHAFHPCTIRNLFAEGSLWDISLVG